MGLNLHLGILHGMKAECMRRIGLNTRRDDVAEQGLHGTQQAMHPFWVRTNLRIAQHRLDNRISMARVVFPNLRRLVLPSCN